MKAIVKITATLLFTALLFACKKDHDVLGVDVQPADDALNVGLGESAAVYAYTQKYDSICSLDDRYKYLGINKDPYFGTTDVGLYLTPSIPDGKTYVSFGDDATLVSSEIILAAYNLGISHVGPATAQVSYSIFPLSTALDATKIYYSDYDHFHTTGSVLGVYTGSYTVMNGTPVLRIPVDKNFAAALMSNSQYLVDNTVFQSTYKGFYIKCSLNGDEGLITQVDLEDALSGFYLYYQNGTPSATKADKSFRFAFGGTNPARYNTMKHNFQGAATSLVQQVLGNDSTKGADNLFLKGMGVSKARVYIPTLKNFSDSFVVAVNRAELVFNLDPAFSTSTEYTPPAKLCLLPADSTGHEAFALDQINATDAARYDGNYDSDKKRYVFNIARHVQAVLAGKKKNYGFYLVVGNADNLLTYTPVYNGLNKELFLVRRDGNIERVVLAGSSNTTLKPVFNLSYIKLRHD